MYIYIVDDHPLSRRILKGFLGRWFREESKVGYVLPVLEFASVVEAVESLEEYPPVLVFLDIEMPTEDGFGLYNYLDVKSCRVVFYSAYSEKYWVKSVNEKGCFGFLKKPLSPGDFELVMERFYEAFSNDLSECVMIKDDEGGFRWVSYRDIVLLESDKNYVKFFIYDGSSFKLKRSLSSLLEELPRYFIQVYRSRVVNTMYLMRMDDSFLQLRTIEEPVMVSKKFASNLRHFVL